jgi:hypothetical protein
MLRLASTDIPDEAKDFSLNKWGYRGRNDLNGYLEYGGTSELLFSMLDPYRAFSRQRLNQIVKF